MTVLMSATVSVRSMTLSPIPQMTSESRARPRPSDAGLPQIAADGGRADLAQHGQIRSSTAFTLTMPPGLSRRMTRIRP